MIDFGFRAWLAESAGSDVLIYRGTRMQRYGSDENTKGQRIGAWWTENPGYAFKYAGGQPANMFVAKMKSADLQRLMEMGAVQNVSIDEWPNYYFVLCDPPGARSVTEEEYRRLEATGRKSTSPIGGGMFGWGADMATVPMEAGRKIWASVAPGSADEMIKCMSRADAAERQRLGVVIPGEAPASTKGASFMPGLDKM